MTIGKPVRIGKLLFVCISDMTNDAILKIHNFELDDGIPELTPLTIFEPNYTHLIRCPTTRIKQ